MERKKQVFSSMQMIVISILKVLLMLACLKCRPKIFCNYLLIALLSLLDIMIYKNAFACSVDDTVTLKLFRTDYASKLLCYELVTSVSLEGSRERERARENSWLFLTVNNWQLSVRGFNEDCHLLCEELKGCQIYRRGEAESLTCPWQLALSSHSHRKWETASAVKKPNLSAATHCSHVEVGQGLADVRQHTTPEQASPQQCPLRTEVNTFVS